MFVRRIFLQRQVNWNILNKHEFINIKRIRCKMRGSNLSFSRCIAHQDVAYTCKYNSVSVTYARASWRAKFMEKIERKLDRYRDCWLCWLKFARDVKSADSRCVVIVPSFSTNFTNLVESKGYDTSSCGAARVVEALAFRKRASSERTSRSWFREGGTRRWRVLRSRTTAMTISRPWVVKRAWVCGSRDRFRETCTSSMAVRFRPE